MDISQEYVEMCNCPEIQNNRPENWYEDENFHVYNLEESDTGTWLPRQDQLQEMIKSIPWEMAYRGEKCGYMARVIRDFAPWEGAKKIERNIPIPMHYHAPSAEQVLLELLMHEIHGKKWNGEEWIK